MPIINSSIPEVMVHIVHPITEQVTADILRVIGLGKYFGDSIYYISDDTSPINSKDKNNKPKIREDRCEVNIEPVFNPTQMKWDAFQSIHALGHGIRSNRINYPMFQDEFHDIRIDEYTVPFYLKLRYTLRIADKNIAYMVTDNLYSRFYHSSINEYKSLLYSYPVPTEFLVTLYALYKQCAFANMMTFEDYITKGMVNIDILKNKVGNDSQLVFQKYIHKAIGEMTLDIEKPEADKRNQVIDRTNIEFSYDLQMFRPAMLELKYPSVVNNVIIPLRCRPKQEIHQPKVYEYNYNEVAFQEYLNSGMKDIELQPIVNFPDFDDWKVPVPEQDNTVTSTPRSYRPIFICAMTLDTNRDGTINPATTINLIDDFPDEFQLHPTIIEALYIQGEHCFSNNGLIQIDVYANDYPMDKANVSIDKDFNLSIKASLPYKRYHLVISICMNFTSIYEKYVAVVLRHAEYFVPQMVQNVNWLIDNKYIELDEDSNIKILPYNYLTDTAEDARIKRNMDIVDGTSTDKTLVEEIQAYKLLKKKHQDKYNSGKPKTQEEKVQIPVPDIQEEKVEEKIQNEVTWANNDVTKPNPKSKGVPASIALEEDRTTSRDVMQCVVKHNRSVQGYDETNVATWEFNPYNPVSWDFPEYDEERPSMYPHIDPNHVQLSAIHNKEHPLYQFFFNAGITTIKIANTLAKDVENINVGEVVVYNGMKYTKDNNLINKVIIKDANFNYDTYLNQNK